MSDIQPLMIQVADAWVQRPMDRRVRKVSCPECGLIFDYATRGVAKREMTKHRKRAHPDTVEAY